MSGSLNLELRLLHDGKEWRLYNWRGQYATVKNDLSNIQGAVQCLLGDVARVIQLIGEGKWGA